MATVNLPRAVYPAGTRQLPVVSVPVGATQATIVMNRFNWPNPGQIVATITIEFSLDGGVTWNVPIPGKVNGMSAGLGGGQTLFKGNPDAPSLIGIAIPGDPASTLRRARVTIINTVALDTSATLTVI